MFRRELAQCLEGHSAYGEVFYVDSPVEVVGISLLPVVCGDWTFPVGYCGISLVPASAIDTWPYSGSAEICASSRCIGFTS